MLVTTLIEGADSTNEVCWSQLSVPSELNAIQQPGLKDTNRAGHKYEILTVV